VGEFYFLGRHWFMLRLKSAAGPGASDYACRRRTGANRLKRERM